MVLATVRAAGLGSGAVEQAASLNRRWLPSVVSPHASSRNTGHSGRSHPKETARCKHTGWWFTFFIKQAFPCVNYRKKSLKEQISITLNSTRSAALRKCPEHQPGWSKTRAGKRERRFREWKTADKWVPTPQKSADMVRARRTS